MTATVPRTDPPLTAPSNRPAGGGRTTNHYATTLEHRTRHDAPTGAGFARTAVNSMALYAMPLHVGEIVRHACKVLPP
jgi:hypothetical protein